jgi:hypothetical protein
VFTTCSSLTSIWIPSSVQDILSEYQGLLKIQHNTAGSEKVETAGMDVAPDGNYISAEKAPT